ncbi:glycoside hydrolase family 3 N-terminal domain-containing protein [Candidatus Tisiphia endosymbiont of Oplodontha viridula]|uniref:glycoside hydrolase family 3 N-terminal domain-containing protein n=1 Tax=Candidatus Tisiphia endosymbiont of Oplodontha viridula TaxID=3077925 RepID=UPI0035C9084A
MSEVKSSSTSLASEEKTLSKIKPFIFGVAGTSLTPEEKVLFSKNPVHGFILFGRNIDNPKQLKQLVKGLRNLYEHDILIFIDQEGGRVARLKPPMVDQEYPAAAEFGKIYEKNAKEAKEKVFENYSNIMKGLNRYGINSPCSPDADLTHPYTNGIIGNRSFGSSVNQVVELCTKAIEAINSQNGIAIAKHMPGHGRAALDSHTQLPHVTASLAELNDTDFAVFRQLSKIFENNKAVWGMVAHIVFDSIDPKLPTSVSSTAIKFIREKIGFKGTLVSDDICMGALHAKISDEYSKCLKIDLILRKYPVTDAKEMLNTMSDEDLKVLIDGGIVKDRYDYVGLQRFLTHFAKIRAEWIRSLVEVAKQIITVDNNYIVLHCSGDIEEMSALCDVIPTDMVSCVEEMSETRKK